MVGNDLGKLIADVLGIKRLISQSGESDTRLVELALANEESGRLGKESQTAGENQSPSHLKTDRDTVAGAVIAVLGAIIDAAGKKQTDADAELVSGNDGASNLARGDFAHVENDDGRDETHTETGDKSTSDDQAERGGGGLEDHTDDKDHATQDDSELATNPIGQITSGERTEECTSRQDRGDERFLPGGEDESTGAFDGLDEEVHAHHTGDVTRVVTEEDTTKGGEDAHQVRLHGNGGFHPEGVSPNGGSRATGHVD